jgi:DNA-binding CsgD family transcriptional regulator
MDDDESWRESALCAQTDPDLFFPEKGGSAVAPKKICAACTVREACLQDALDTDDVWDGIRGGMSPTERRALRPGGEPEGLTHRDLAVKRMVEANMTSAAIAREIGVDPRTVDRIRAKVRRAA